MLTALTLSLVLTQAPQKLRWDPRVDLPVTGALVGGWLLSETALKRTLAPQACRWCETNTLDTGVRRTFNRMLTPSADGLHGADAASNWVGFLALPLAVVGLDAFYTAHDGVFVEAFPVDLVLMLESTFSALAVNQVVKFSVGRARPYTVGASEALLGDGTDHHLSFFSGHSTFAFATVASAATIARLRGYRLWWLTWLVGVPLATATATLRLAADKHWATDVLIGSTFGTLVGVLMPSLLHGSVGPVTARVAPAGTGLAVTGTF